LTFDRGGQRGSLDTWRDPQGFAVTFYTSEGNLDIVGNNTPVFFVRDPMKFQHFIRPQKRRADNNLRGHDMQGGFLDVGAGVGAPGHVADGDRSAARSRQACAPSRQAMA
jgi:hypothetical protein